MNDWLNEIETEEEDKMVAYIGRYDGHDIGTANEKHDERILRMACVLRELAAYLKDVCELRRMSLPDASNDVKELMK